MQDDPNHVLNKIREEIDAIDAQMHSLLIERSKVIDYLIKVKEQQGGASAFRPGREAAIMKILAQRHKGNLPIDTIESIWRIIIATFTYVQAPYYVHLDCSEEPDKIWDSARFHFGFTVPLCKHNSAHHVIDAIMHGKGDLGMVPVYKMALEGAWWTAFIGPERPKIIARLPFLTRTNHPTQKLYYVLSKPLAEAMSREVILGAISMSQWSPKIEPLIHELNGSIITSSPQGDRLCSLIAIPQPHNMETFRDLCIKNGLADITLDDIGSHAAPFSTEAVTSS